MIKLLTIILLNLFIYKNTFADDYFLIDQNYESNEIDLIIKHIKSLGYKVIIQKDNIMEVFFDTPELQVLQNNDFIKYDVKEYTSKKKKKIKLQESIVIGNGKALNKFNVKHYNKAKLMEDKHPLLSLIKRKERKQFTDLMKLKGIAKPLRLKSIFKQIKIVHNYKIYKEKTLISEVSFQKISASAFKKSINFNILGFHGFKETENSKLQKQIKLLFNVDPELNSANHYSIGYQQIKNNIALFDLRLRFPFITKLMNAFYFSLFGIFIIVVFLWNYRK